MQQIEFNLISNTSNINGSILTQKFVINIYKYKITYDIINFYFIRLFQNYIKKLTILIIKFKW